MNKKWLTFFLAGMVLLAVVPGSGCKKSETVRQCNELESGVRQTVTGIILYLVPALGDFSNHIYVRVRSLVEDELPPEFGEYDESTGWWRVENLSVRSLILQDNDLIANAWVQLLNADGFSHRWYDKDITRTIKVFDAAIKVAADGSNPIEIPSLDLTQINVSGKPVTANGQGSVEYLGTSGQFFINDADFKQDIQKDDYGPYDYVPINGEMEITIGNIKATLVFNGGGTLNFYVEYDGDTYVCTLTLPPHDTIYPGK